MAAILSDPTLAAWLQAFAAVVALAISVWAVLRTDAEARRKDKLKARAVAVAIYSEFLKLKVIVDEMDGYLDSLKTMERVVGQNVAYRISEAQLTIPAMIERNIDNFYLLGEPAGPAALQFVNMVSQYNGFVQDIAGRVVMMNAEQWPVAVDQLKPHLRFLSQIAEKVATEVKPLHDAVKS